MHSLWVGLDPPHGFILHAYDQLLVEFHTFGLLLRLLGNEKKHGTPVPPAI